MNSLISGATISIAFLLGACGSSSGGGDSSSDSITGLWNVTEVDPDFGEDIGYIRIFTDGRVIYYDYQQDEYDAGDNCYLIDNDQTLTPIGGNQYRSEIAGFPAFTQTMTITRSGNVLTVSYADTFDINDNGDFTEILNFSYPMLTGVDPVFNECS